MQQAALGLLLHGSRHTVGAEDDRACIRHLGQILDEHGADAAQPLHDVLVVHHLVADVNRRPKQLDGAFHDVDGAIDPGTETARIGQQYVHQEFRLASSSASNNKHAAPTVMAESATLKAGKYARSQ